MSLHHDCHWGRSFNDQCVQKMNELVAKANLIPPVVGTRTFRIRCSTCGKRWRVYGRRYTDGKYSFDMYPIRWFRW